MFENTLNCTSLFLYCNIICIYIDWKNAAPDKNSKIYTLLKSYSNDSFRGLFICSIVIFNCLIKCENHLSGILLKCAHTKNCGQTLLCILLNIEEFPSVVLESRLLRIFIKIKLYYTSKFFNESYCKWE